MRYQKDTQLPCSLQEAFDFHCDITNLPKLSPPDTHVKLLNQVENFQKGTIIELHAQKGYKSMKWVVQITEFQPPYFFTDTAIKSPFKKWRHTHRFYQQDGKTYMKDIVEVELLFGWLGKLFENFVKRELDVMFHYRHRATIELMQKNS